MNTYKIKYTESNKVLNTGLSLLQARELVNQYDTEDKKDGIYVPDFYEIVEEKKC